MQLHVFSYDETQYKSMAKTQDKMKQSINFSTKALFSRYTYLRIQKLYGLETQ